MNSESASARNRSALQSLPALAALAAFMALPTTPAHAEDPLLGRIKVIQCVGCTAGSVDLVIHDPIDVRDFQVRINEGDYQKIITPLAGKTVYDKEGCFYWMDVPKGGKAAEPTPAGAPAAPVKETKETKTAKGGKKDAHKGATADTSAAVPAEGLVETVAPAATPEIQGTPSKCIPYALVEVKPTRTGKKEEE